MAGRAVRDQLAEEDLLLNGRRAAINPAYNPLNGGVTNLPGGLSQRGNTNAHQLCSFQFAKAE